MRNYRISQTLVATLILASLALLSCEDGVEPKDNGKEELLPLEIGNYWIYESYELNKNGNRINESVRIDSILITDRNASYESNPFRLVRFVEGVAKDTLLVTSDDKYLYLLRDSTNLDFKLMEATWFTIANKNVKPEEYWNIHNGLLVNFPYELNDTIFNSTYQYTINGRLEYQDSIQLEGIKRFRKNFFHKFDSRLFFDILEKKYNQDGSYYYDTLKYSKYLKYYDYYWFAENVGCLRYKRPPYDEEVITEPSSSLTKIETRNGRESVLIRHNVTK